MERENLIARAQNVLPQNKIRKHCIWYFFISEIYINLKIAVKVYDVDVTELNISSYTKKLDTEYIYNVVVN